MYPFIINTLLFNLTIVLIIETAIAFVFGARKTKDIFTVMLVNILTNPPVVLSGLTMAMFINHLEKPLLYVIEIIVFLLEGFIYSKCKTFCTKNPYLISFVLNFITFALGELINIFM